MPQTTQPLLMSTSNPAVPIWAVFANCAGIFEKDATRGDLPPIIRPVVTMGVYEVAVLDASGTPIAGMRALYQQVLMNIMELPDALKDKGKMELVDEDECVLGNATGANNFVALVYVPDPAKYIKRCQKKRAEVEAQIRDMYVSKLIVPDKRITGPDGKPIHH